MARSAWRAMTLLGVLYACLVLALSAVNVLAPQRNGLLAISQILAPLLFVPLLLLLPLAVARVSSGAHVMRRWLRIALVSCAIVAVVRFVPVWIPLPSTAEPGGGIELGVTTWNVEAGALQPAAVVGALQDARSGVVGIEELTNRTSVAIAADPTLLQRFPYRMLMPSDDSLGIGLLSSYPFVGTPGTGRDPPLIHAVVDLGSARSVEVVVTHPQPGKIRTVGVLPVDFDSSVRDAEIATIRSIVEPLIAGAKPLLVLGDFNTTDRELVYGDLSSGLKDVQRAVGWGPGSTWRPDSAKWLPFGLLRIDIVFVANGVVPLNISPDCTPRGSDHCIVRASVTLP